MYTIDSIPESFVQKFSSVVGDDEKGTTPPCTVHCILSAFLTLGDPQHLGKYELWKKAWPTRRDFEDSMPILWSRDLRGSESSSLLPPAISGRWNTIPAKEQPGLLLEQEKRLRKDWEHVRAVFPDTDWEAYSYNWLIVNTRCFFYLMPGDEPPEDQNDAMAMVPFADYFNHSDGPVWILIALLRGNKFDMLLYIHIVRCKIRRQELYISCHETLRYAIYIRLIAFGGAEHLFRERRRNLHELRPSFK